MTSLKTTKLTFKTWINIWIQFAIKVAARATQIPLNMFTHGIAMLLKTRKKTTTEDTSNVIFETTLELI
jgi:hypothetical protein